MYIEDETTGTNRCALIAASNGTDHQNQIHGIEDNEEQRHDGVVKTSTLPPHAIDIGVDEKLLERQFVAYILEHATQDSPVTIPVLGEYCITYLGFSMKGYLHRFLVARPHLFDVPDDGRQWVLLKQGAALAVGLNSNESLPSLPSDLLLTSGGNEDGKQTVTASVSEDGYYPHRAAAAGKALKATREWRDGDQANTNNHATSTHGGGCQEREHGESAQALTLTLKRPADYEKWDRLTQLMFDFVVTQGGMVTFKGVDEYMRSKHSHVIHTSGIPPPIWLSKTHSFKRRNIFKKEGPYVTLHGLPRGNSTTTNGKQNNNNNNNNSSSSTRAGIGMGGREEEEEEEDPFPPLSTTTATPPSLPSTPGLRPHSDVSTNTNTNTNTSTLQSTISTIQRENEELKSACVALGREVLAVKAELVALKGHVAALTQRVHGASPPPASIATTPMVAGGGGGGDVPLHAATHHPPPTDASYLFAFDDYSRGRTMACIALIGGHDGTEFLDSVEWITPDHHQQQQHPWFSSNSSSNGSKGVVDWSGLGGRETRRRGETAPLPPLPSARGFCAAAVDPEDGTLFVVGGGNGKDWDCSLRLCPTSRADHHHQQRQHQLWWWQSLSPLNHPRGSLAAGVAQGYLYAFGGGKHGEQANTVEWYDPESNTWRYAAPLTSSRFALSGVALGGVLYACGGYDGTSYLNTTERYDPREGRWAPTAPMLLARGGHASCCSSSITTNSTSGTTIYAIGGYSHTAMKECEAYEVRMNQWRAIAPLSTCRAYGAAAMGGSSGSGSSGERVYALGGVTTDMTTHAPLIEMYCPVKDQWDSSSGTGTSSGGTVGGEVKSAKRSFLAAAMGVGVGM